MWLVFMQYLHAVLTHYNVRLLWVVDVPLVSFPFVAFSLQNPV